MSMPRASPRRSARRSSTSHATSRPRAAPFAPATTASDWLGRSGGTSTAPPSAAPPAAPARERREPGHRPQGPRHTDGHRERGARRAAGEEEKDHGQRPEAPLQHRPEQPHRRQGNELVAERVQVHEGRREPAPDLVGSEADVDGPKQAEVEVLIGGIDDRGGQRRDDQRQRGPGPDVGGDPLDLVGPQPRQPRPALLWWPLGGRAALELGGPLANPLPAIRALGDVRADLGPAVLADDEEVRLGHGPQGTRPGWLFARYIDRLGHGRLQDLADDLSQVVVRLVDHDLTRGAVAAVEDVLEAIELLDRAEVLRVRPE